MLNAKVHLQRTRSLVIGCEQSQRNSQSGGEEVANVVRVRGLQVQGVARKHRVVPERQSVRNCLADRNLGAAAVADSVGRRDRTGGSLDDRLRLTAHASQVNLVEGAV